jgi:hypothetical protein
MAQFKAWRNGDDARTDFERTTYDIFEKLGDARTAGLSDAFAQLEMLSPQLRGCLFDERLVRKMGERGLTVDDIREALVREGGAYVGNVLRGTGAGPAKPGVPRPIERTWTPPPDYTGGKQTFVGPWPWLTAIRPNPVEPQEYGNVPSYRPAPEGPKVFNDDYQFAMTCVSRTNEDKPSEIRVECDKKRPDADPNSPWAAACEGGDDYKAGGYCLEYPTTVPGASISIRGFNFVQPTAFAVFQNVDHPEIRVEVEGVVWGDQVRPATDAQGRVLADYLVRDFLDVEVPNEHPLSPGTPLPPGTYQVSVAVKNDNTTWITGKPARLDSVNKLFLRVLPDPNTSFDWWSESGSCIEETDGIGSDEAWFDAWVGHYVGPEGPSGPQEPLKLSHVEFSRDAWDDMDSGDDAWGYTATLLNGTIGRRGLVIAAVLGWEVDSEDAAREGIRKMGEAWGFFWKEYLVPVLLVGGGSGGAAAWLNWAGVAFNPWGLLIICIAVAVMVIVSILYASWAAPDRIAVDLFALDAMLAYNLTEPNTSLPPAVGPLQFEEIQTWHNPQRKEPNGATMRYVVNHDYVSPDDGGEDSHYMVTFKLTRGLVSPP